MSLKCFLAAGSINVLRRKGPAGDLIAGPKHWWPVHVLPEG